MSKTYDEDDLKRVAAIVAENIVTRIDTMEENMDARIESKVRQVVNEELAEVRQGIKIIKAAVTDTNKDLHLLEKRVSRFKAA